MFSAHVFVLAGHKNIIIITTIFIELSFTAQSHV